MPYKMRTIRLGIVGIFVLACLLLAGCAGVQPTTGTPPTAMPWPIPATSEPTASLSHTTMSPTSVKLAISHPPRLGETAYLTVTVVSVFDAPNSESRLKLPKGAVLLGGDLRWQGSLKANVPVQFSAAIKFVETGQKTITAVAESIESATSSVGGVDEVVLDVAETSGQFHVYDPRTPQPIEKLVPGHAPVTVYPDAPPVLSGTQPPAIPVPSAVPTPTSDPPVQRSESVPIGIKLAISHPPRLGETAYLTVTVVSVFDAPNSEARIELPKGAVLLVGDPRWQGSLKANVPVQFSTAIKFVEAGQKTITAVAKSVESATSSVSAVDEVVLDVAETSGQFHVYDPRTSQPIEKLVPGHAPVIIYPDAPPVLSGTQPPAIPVPPASEEGMNLAQVTTPAGQLTITGRWYRYDRNSQLVGVNKCLVGLYTGTNNLLEQGYTDSTGSYSIGPVSNPGGDVWVRIYAYALEYQGGPEVASIHVGGTQPYTFAYLDAYNAPSPTEVFSDGTHDIGAYAVTESTNNDRKAWWIKDDLERGYQKRFELQSIASAPNGSYIAEWPTSATGYHPNGHIDISLVDANDTSDTVLHEMGHAVMYYAYGNSSPPACPPGNHYVKKVSSPSCGWSEGWAQMWHMYVNGDSIHHYPGDGSDDLENQTWGTAGWDNGDQVEGRVAGALWDLFDYDYEYDPISGTWRWRETWDNYSEGMTHIWAAMTSGKSDTFWDFWGKWKNSWSSGNTDTDRARYADGGHATYQNTIVYQACWGDESMSFTPTNPEPGSNVEVAVTSRIPHAYIDLKSNTAPAPFWFGIDTVGNLTR